MKLYIVQGSNRDYSMGTDWLVAAYTDKEAALQHCELANKYLKSKPNGYENEEIFQKWMNNNPYDKVTIDYANDYEVREVHLYRHVDEYQELA